MRALPGVRVAGAVRALPLGSTIGDFGLRVEGFTPAPGTGAKGDWQIATPGYLEAMGERVIRGRASPQTTSRTPCSSRWSTRRWCGATGPAAIRSADGSKSAAASRTVPSSPSSASSRNVRHNGITEGVKEKFYVPHTQWHKSVGNAIRSMTLVIKAQGDPQALANPARQTVRELDANLPVAAVRTMDEIVAATLSAPRFTGMLLGVFAALALVLSAIGIYGVLSYVVSRRTREIGIRVAIGAGRGQVLRLVLGSGIGLALVGIVIGLAAAASLSRLMTTLLHDVQPGDPATYAAVAGALTVVAIAASLIPAWRATRVDPVRALKAE